MNLTNNDDKRLMIENKMIKLRKAIRKSTRYKEILFIH